MVVGPGSVEVLGDLGEHLGPVGKGSLVVADAAVVASGFVGSCLAALGSNPAVVHVVPPHEPTVASVDEAADVVRRHRPGVVIAVGGGSALDTAKQAAAVAGAGHSIDHYALGRHPLPATGPPVVAVPTTAGTGAEVTRTCVVTSAAGHKLWTWGAELLPRLVVLDPVATVTMPAAVTAATGLDAFVHAVEAVTGRRTSSDVAAPALEALRFVVDHLPSAVTDGTDLSARQGMQRAAFLAGLAIDGGGTGIAHSIGHALGSLAHVPHGLAVAVGLAAALPWNVEGAPETFAPVADVLGVPVDDLAGVYAELLAAASFADACRRVGPLDLDARALAAEMVAEANQPMLGNNCRLADAEARLALADATLTLWAGYVRGGAR